MKRINIHHFPQDPYQEPPQTRSHSRPHHTHHQHHSNRRYSFIHTHGTYHQQQQHHHQQQQHHLLSSLTSRSFRKNLSLPRLRDQFSNPTAAASRENTGSNVAPTPEEHSPSFSATPIPVAETRSNSFSATNEDDDRLVMSFLRDYLNHDGVLVLYILQLNTNEVITGEIVTALYEIFRANHRADTNE